MPRVCFNQTDSNGNGRGCGGGGTREEVTVLIRKNVGSGVVYQTGRRVLGVNRITEEGGR